MILLVITSICYRRFILFALKFSLVIGEMGIQYYVATILWYTHDNAIKNIHCCSVVCEKVEKQKITTLCWERSKHHSNVVGG